MKIPDFIAEILRELDEAGYESWVVGGCVRDMLLGRRPADYDIATSALPAEVTALFAKTALTGVKYGTVTVFAGGGSAEVTTFRREGKYEDGRRPSSVSFDGCVGSDLSRRDFTANAIAFHPRKGLLDPFGGCGDIRNKILRAVGDPDERFCEDALRILRAFRFSAQLGFMIEPQTLSAAKRQAVRLQKISGERVKAEMDRILLSSRPDKVFEILPFGVPGLPGHSASGHEADNLALVPCRLSARWAAFCLSTGCAAGGLFTRLKFDNRLRREVSALLSEARHGPAQTKVGVKQRLDHVGPELYRLFLQLYAALYRADTRQTSALVDDIIEKKEPYCLTQLAVTGADLLACGIPAGPEIGRTLRRLLGAVWENPELNEKDALLRLAGGESQK